MLFFKSKTLSHQQAAMIGFVLGLLSLLVTAIVVFVFPLFGVWLNNHGVYQLDIFLMAFIFVFFAAVQILLLVGIPLHYASQDKNDMTGWRIVFYALVSMLVMVTLTGAFLVLLNAQTTYTVDELDGNVSSEESI